ncbi:uncharacterized protein LOC121393593 [Xenopus laevis]|uniref:Uncharacterized protein LOC121393593 n=1 Tax=Xenopus laevis TaxID=8355 RepID=A0A8J1KM31_XENLA|nr:uncharacterized protein LOC121393593 [Xenopus laevis]
MITCRLLLYNIIGVIFLSILSSQCELYFAVVYPFQYVRSMTKSRTVGILVFCWIFPSIMTLIYGLFEESTSTFKGISNIVSNLCVFIIMFGLNIKLYLIAKSQQQREHSGTQDTKKSSLRLIIVVSFTFLLLWTPATANECVCSLCTCRTFERDAINPFSILIVVASVVNPILYLCGSRAVRAALWKNKVPCTFCKRNINPQNQGDEEIPGSK